jgi:hypothetical protein
MRKYCACTHCTGRTTDKRIFIVYRTKKNFNTKDIMRFGAFNFEKHVFLNFTFQNIFNQCQHIDILEEKNFKTEKDWKRKKKG